MNGYDQVIAVSVSSDEMSVDRLKMHQLFRFVGKWQRPRHREREPGQSVVLSTMLMR